MTAAVESKTCPGCPSRGVQPAGAFWRNKPARDGLQRYCKACLSEMQAESAARSAIRWADRIGSALTVALVFVGIALAGFVFAPVPFEGPAAPIEYEGAL